MLGLFALPTLAFPGVPYSGSASVTAISAFIDLPAADLDVVIGYQMGWVEGAADSPVWTTGTSDAISVTLASGTLPGAEISEYAVSTLKIYDGNPTPITATNSVTNVNRLMVDATILELGSTSWVSNIVGQTDGTGYVSNFTIYGDPLGLESLVSADSAAEQVEVNNIADDQFSMAQTELVNVSVDIMNGVVPVNILTVDVLTSTTSTSSDATPAGASASATIEFVNLTINATDYSLAPPNTVVTVTSGFPAVDVARVIIKPIIEASSTLTTSVANSTALSIEILLAGTRGTSGGGPGLNAPGVDTEITIGEASSTSFADNNSATGPTLISMGAISIDQASTWLPVVLLLSLLTSVTGFLRWQKII